MAFTKTGIANEALRLLGQPSVTSIDPSDGSTGAEVMSAFYDSTKDATLELTDWKFARNGVNLGAALTLTDAEKMGWSYVHSVPSNVVRIVCLQQSADYPGTPWQHAGDRFFSEFASPDIIYVKSVAEGLFDGQFVKVMASMLAIQGSYALTADSARARDMLDFWLPIAQTTNEWARTTRTINLDALKVVR